jgi:hypothetical protein
VAQTAFYVCNVAVAVAVVIAIARISNSQVIVAPRIDVVSGIIVIVVVVVVVVGSVGSVEI